MLKLICCEFLNLPFFTEPLHWHWLDDVLAKYVSNNLNLVSVL
jgi:hypothetical protein